MTAWDLYSPCFWTWLPYIRMEKGKSCGLAYAGSATYCSHCGTQGDVFQFSTDFLSPWFPLLSFPVPWPAEKHSVLARSAESVSEKPLRIVVFDHCKTGNFAFLPPHLARWDGRNSCRHPQKYLLSGKPTTLLIIMQGLMKLNIIIPSHATFNFLDHNFSFYQKLLGQTQSGEALLLSAH